MAGIRFIPEAEDLTPRGSSGTMSGEGGPRATLHCTVSGTRQFDDMHAVLVDKMAEPHLLYSFAEDRLGQYFALDRSARSLMGAPDVPRSHNKAGSVNIQIEVVARTDDWTTRRDWRPGPNFRAMVRAVRGWGVEDRLVFRFARSADDRRAVVRPRSLLHSPDGGGCWWGHCHYPAPESHWDPGRVDVGRFFAAVGGVPLHLTEEEDDMQFEDTVPTTAKERKAWRIRSLSVEEALKSAVYARKFAWQAKRDAAAALEIVKTMAALNGLSDDAIADARGRNATPEDAVADAGEVLAGDGAPVDDPVP